MTRSLTITATLLALCAASLSAHDLPKSGSNLGSVQGGEFTAARRIIVKKCNRCHSAKRIDLALSANKDLFDIQHDMEKKGVELNATEREVLGIYWKKQNPLKK